MEADILKLLDAGGNLATIGLLLVMWKFDRRLVKIETVIEQHITGERNR